MEPPNKGHFGTSHFSIALGTGDPVGKCVVVLSLSCLTSDVDGRCNRERSILERLAASGVH